MSSSDKQRQIQASNITSSALTGATINTSICSSPTRVRSFGSVIDVNSPPRHRLTPLIRSLASTISDLQLDSSTAAKLVRSPLSMSNQTENKASSGGDVSCIKKHPKECNNDLFKSNTVTTGKRKFNDENCDFKQSTDEHRSKRLSVKKTVNKNELPSKEIESASITSRPISSLATCTSKCSPKKPLSIVQTESQPQSGQLPLHLPSTSALATFEKSKSEDALPTTSNVASLYSNDRQLKWITEPDANNDPGYYHVLIEQQFQALQETWAENDRLKEEIATLQQENDLLDPLFQQVIELKEMLLDDNNQDQVETQDDNGNSI